jgi:glycosyltransferase involved in cell wall biosynthesis
MRVLLLCYRGNPFCGGQGIYIYYLSRELKRLGAEVDVITGPPYPDDMSDWAHVHKTESMNIWSIRTSHIPLEKLNRLFSPFNFIEYILTRFHIFPEMETFSFRAFFLLSELLKKKSYDIIHDVNTLGWGLVPMKGYGIPVISTIHHPLTRDRAADLTIDKSFWEKVTTILFYPLNMQRFVINRLHRVITSSMEGIDELNSAFGLDKKKITVVYNGMDIEQFTNSGALREENALLFVGNTEDHKKGLIFLLETMKQLPEEVTLTIVDDGPPKKVTAHNMIVKMGLENRVKMTGKLSYHSLVEIYSSKTILVMSSLYEGFGLPAAEAMACGTPVVVTDAGALKEVVDESCGIIVPMRDPKAMADAVMKLLKDPALRQRMGEAGRRRAVENFSWQAAAANTMKVYEDVIVAHDPAYRFNQKA